MLAMSPFCLSARDLFAHSGHQEPPCIVSGLVFHTCPFEHCQDKAVKAPIYSDAKHLPPLAFARICISPIESNLFFALDFTAHAGHLVRPFTLPGVAFHLCPLAHCHSSGVILLTYSLERHFPPLYFAISLISSRVDLRLLALS